MSERTHSRFGLVTGDLGEGFDRMLLRSARKSVIGPLTTEEVETVMGRQSWSLTLLRKGVFGHFVVWTFGLDADTAPGWPCASWCPRSVL